MAVPTLRAFQASGSSSATSLTISKPTGTLDGDVMLVSVIVFVSSGVTLTLSGTWTPLPGYAGVYATRPYTTQAWVRRAASEPASWSLTWTGSAKVWRSAQVSSWFGVVGAGSPIDPAAGGSFQIEAASNSAFTAPAITTTSGDDIAVAMGETDLGGTWTLTGTGGFTKVGENGDGMHASKSMASAGSTTDQTGTNAIANGRLSSGQIALLSATAPGGADPFPAGRVAPWQRRIFRR